jgi:hypothetical protein
MIPKSGNRFSDKIMLTTKNLRRAQRRGPLTIAAACSGVLPEETRTAAGGRLRLSPRGGERETLVKFINRDHPKGGVELAVTRICCCATARAA